MIRQLGDSVLTKRAEPYVAFGSAAFDLYKEMREALMWADGLAVAAPQVGASLQAIMYWPDLDQPGVGMPIIAFNPKITSHSPVQFYSIEGCLSIPGATFSVRRWEQVCVDAQNITGKPFRKYSQTRLEAAMFQHELDHLNGVLLPDRCRIDGGGQIDRHKRF